MKREDLNVCTAQPGVKPIKMCAGQTGWCRRPRFFWPKDFGPFGNSESWLEEQEDWYKLVTTFEKPSCSSWLQPGSSWAGEAEGHLHPTFVRFTPRDKETFMPAGKEGCQPHELARWEYWLWAFPPYQMKDMNLVTASDGDLRFATVAERERMLHFPMGYCLAATPSGMDKTDPECVFMVEASLLGNTMDCLQVSWQFGHLDSEWGYLRRPPTFREIQDDDVEKLHVFEDKLEAGDRTLTRSFTLEERLVWWCHGSRWPRGHRCEVVGRPVDEAGQDPTARHRFGLVAVEGPGVVSVETVERPHQ